MNDFVTCARGWIGTPYVHQAARRGAGCDCLGLVRGVWAEATKTDPIPVPPYTPDWSEPQGDEALWRAGFAYLVPKEVTEPALGDILLFRMCSGSVAKHVALQSDVGETAKFIHAYQGHGVTENAFSAPWQRRLVARFAFPPRS